VLFGSELLTYAELDRKANQLADYLKGIGVGKEQVVGLHLERSPASVIGALAVMKAGAAYLPLDPASPAERLRYMLTDAKVGVVLSRGVNAERLLKNTWTVLDWDFVETTLGRYRSTEPAATSLSGDSLAYVIYTSGSTGKPKGVEATHGGLRNLVDWHLRAFHVTATDRGSLQAVVGFDAAVWELWPYLAAGASVHIPEDSVRSNAEAMRDWLVKEKISVAFSPTALAEQMLLLQWPSGCALRLLLTGADTLHRRPPAGLPFTVVNNYGPTECTVVATSGAVSAQEDRRLPSIGRPIDNTGIYILDEKMQLVKDGGAGEIYIGGAGVARGYRNNPELTAEKFVRIPLVAGPEKLYRTGDRGRFLPNGEIEFSGRLDDQLKIRGYRVEPNEIINALNAFPGVQSSAVRLETDQAGVNRLLAYVVLIPDAEVDPTTLRQMLSQQLPDYMVPAALVRVDALPLTANGKVNLAALPAPTAANALSDDRFVAPRSPVEKRLAGILRPLLHVDRVSVKDNFFLLGGHSLLGTQLLTRISESFGVELSLFGLFDHPTLEEMSLEVEKLIVAKVEAMSTEERRALSQYALEEKR
jgi:amino acid adenylation domain-containing protein